MGNKMQTSIKRLPAVMLETGYSRSTIYDYIKKGWWTKSVPIGPRAVGWPSNEVTAITKARIAGKSLDEIRELVIKLEDERKTAE